MDEAIVTICIPVFNGDKFIIETLNSVNNQTFKNIKVIIMDDCSTDNSVNVIQKWLLDKGERFTFVKNSENLGLLKCSNILLSLTHSLYFQLLGHDDIIYPNKIKAEVEILNELENDVAMVYGNMNVIDNLGNILNNNYFDRAEYFGKPPSGYIYEEIVKGNFINASSVLCKTKMVKNLGGYNEDLFFEDWPMWIQLSVNFKIIYIDSVVGAYRVLPNSMIHSYGNKQIVAVNTFLMYKQFLFSKFPSPKKIKLLMQKFAIYSFKLGAKEGQQFLLTSLKLKFNLKVLVYYLISFSKFMLGKTQFKK